MGLGQERQRRRGGELGSRFVCTWTCRDEKCQEAPFAAIAQNLWREGLHIMTASMRLVHEGCGSGHFTVGGADNDPSLKQSAGARAAAVAGGPTAMGLVDFSRREGSRAACGACAWMSRPTVRAVCPL